MHVGWHRTTAGTGWTKAGVERLARSLNLDAEATANGGVTAGWFSMCLVLRARGGALGGVEGESDGDDVGAVVVGEGRAGNGFDLAGEDETADGDALRPRRYRPASVCASSGTMMTCWSSRPPTRGGSRQLPSQLQSEVRDEGQNTRSARRRPFADSGATARRSAAR